ncbi:hypothetical protein BDM02DRAFT_1411836 [Thelephora ganbajun]|uniref:Uncharacterized protein n=1 Tax=Thelephora ganbajun TaxID=370292 RepID=A0ACB6Z239_THEGA|nr:hypothetical protein BDM02DRAFT_1411836 [Thelephora ganbajun]
MFDPFPAVSIFCRPLRPSIVMAIGLCAHSGGSRGVDALRSCWESHSSPLCIFSKAVHRKISLSSKGTTVY